jgi:hypothetical protein
MSSEQNKEEETSEKTVRKKSSLMTYQAVYDLCKNMGVPIKDFQNYFGYIVLNKNPTDPILRNGLRYLVRLLTEYPHLSPFKKAVTFKEMEDFFKSYLPLNEYMTPTVFPKLIGAHPITYQSLRGRKKGLPSKPMIAVFELVKKKIIEEGTQGVADLLKIAAITHKEKKNEDPSDS